ncbi:MAG: (Fe-S)-binding protein [Chloroflexota bacterium]
MEDVQDSDRSRPSVPLGPGPVARPRFSDLDAPDYDNVLACIRCGLCLSVCPTYNTDHLEVQSPRGRVALIRAVDEGRLSPDSPGFKQHMYHCLDCRACQTICPSGVKVGELVVAARAELDKTEPQPWLERFLKRIALRWVLMRPERVELAMKPVRLYQRLGLQRLLRASRLLGKLPGRLSVLGFMEELLPSLPARPLREELMEVTPSRGERRYRIGFFLGCVMNVVYAEASRATVNVLIENGCEVVTPKAQRCCGAPHAAEGDARTLRELARHNVDLFEQWELDYVVSDCAACAAQTKEYAHLLRDEPEYRDRAVVFSRKVREITELLAEIPLKQPNGSLPVRVTYHEACHLCHAQGVKRQPRKVINQIPGIEFVEMKESDWCCGSAGIYNLTHPERATEILDRKLKNIAATEADVVLTGNPGCLLQLEAGVRRAGLKTRVLHPTQLLDAAYRAQPPPDGESPRPKQ